MQTYEADGSAVTNIIGARIRAARKELGLTQDRLAASLFTKGYISALERGAVRPSLKALQHIASQLGLPISHFVVGVELGAGLEQRGGAYSAPDVEALQEDLNYRYNFARMLLRQGSESSREEAFSVLEAAEHHVTAYRSKLSPRVLYRLHFLRGLAHLQSSEPDRAIPELEKAQNAAGSDASSLITVQNMLGVAHYLLGRASTACHYHRQCLYAIENDQVTDLSLRLSILHNLANDYRALGDVTQAIATYKHALHLVEDLNGIGRQASLLWAQALTYRTANDWAQAKLCATRSLHLYERLDDEAEAASVCLHLGQIFIQEGRFDEAQGLLDKARGFLEKDIDQVLSTNLSTDYAYLHRKKGDLSGAAEHATKGLAGIRNIAGNMGTAAAPVASGNAAAPPVAPPAAPPVAPPVAAAPAPATPPINVMRAYAEALHVAALIEEEQGNHEAATGLFEEAMSLVQGTGLGELTHKITFSYGNVLSERGEYKRASALYKRAAELSAKPRARDFSA